VRRLVVERDAGGDHLHHVPLDDLARELRVLELLADGDAVAGLDELREVPVEGVVREARQRDVLGGAVPRLVRVIPRTSATICASSSKVS
jgi:hypothetical protein